MNFHTWNPFFLNFNSCFLKGNAWPRTTQCGSFCTGETIQYFKGSIPLVPKVPPLKKSLIYVIKNQVFKKMSLTSANSKVYGFPRSPTCKRITDFWPFGMFHRFLSFLFKIIPECFSTEKSVKLRDEWGKFLGVWLVCIIVWTSWVYQRGKKR